MIRHGRAWERLAGREGLGTPELQDELQKESIRNHLALLLNSRHFGSMAFSDYGLPEFNSLCQRDSNVALMLREAIRSAILKYEPRLVDVVVKYSKAIGEEIHFAVEARVRDSGSSQVKFDTSVDGSWRVKVRE